MHKTLIAFVLLWAGITVVSCAEVVVLIDWDREIAVSNTYTTLQVGLFLLTLSFSLFFC
jgi:hypothetical protein